MKVTCEAEVKIEHVHTKQIVEAKRLHHYLPQRGWYSEDEANGTKTEYSADLWKVVEQRKWIDITNEVTCHMLDSGVVRFEHHGLSIDVKNGYRIRSINSPCCELDNPCYLIIEQLDMRLPE